MANFMADVRTLVSLGQTKAALCKITKKCRVHIVIATTLGQCINLTSQHRDDRPNQRQEFHLYYVHHPAEQQHVTQPPNVYEISYIIYKN